MLYRLMNFAESIEIIAHLTHNFIIQAKDYQLTQKPCLQSTTNDQKA